MTKTVSNRRRGERPAPCLWCGAGHAPLLCSERLNVTRSRNGKLVRYPEVHKGFRLCTVCSAIHDHDPAFRVQIRMRLLMNLAGKISR